jgi:ribosomal protein L37AE/L43A
MKTAFCPRCGSSNIKEISDGYYKCFDCGYLGTLGMEKELRKKV